MTTIIISDTHLAKKFSKRKFDYLKRVFSCADRIILNGDFWDGHLVNFDKFINSQWQQLFPILKSKKTIYIYGNHDNKYCNDIRTNLFSNIQVETPKLNVGNKLIHIEHGNKIAPSLDEKFSWLPTNRFIFSLLHILNLLVVKILGKKFYILNSRRNRKMKVWCRSKLPLNNFLICGHSHLAELNPAYRFANTGFVRYGYGHYLRIENDSIKLIEERY